MRIILREDSEAVASTVATLFTLLAVVLFLQAAIVAVVPAKQYEAERTTSIAAISAFDMLRSTASGAAFPGGQVTVTLPIGTAAVSPFAAPSPGDLRFNMGDSTSANISVSYVPTIHDSHVSKVDQDIILAIDGSGSMSQNDPNRLRISGAKEYIGRLSRPDRVASIEFQGTAWLIRQNVGGPAHHLYNTYNNGLPDYSGAQSDLDTIGQTDGTNFGAALQIANDELITYGIRSHALAVILLTDGYNNFAWEDTLALAQAGRAKANNTTLSTNGLGARADAVILTQIAQTTGGTYYAAPTADSIKFIYLEIANHYSGSVSCGTLVTASSISGSLILNRGNRQYPVQTMSLEAGGVTLGPAGGQGGHPGIPVAF